MFLTMNSGEVQKKVSEFAGAPSIVLQWNQQVVVSKMGPQLARITPPALEELCNLRWITWSLFHSPSLVTINDVLVS